jgi:SAM-dependent methyltransferase
VRIDYDRYAHLYDDRHRHYAVDANLVAFVAGCREPDAVRVLDVGCGTGKQLATNRTRFPRLTMIGVDRAINMLAIARRRDASVSWVHGDAQALPLTSGSVDYATNQYSYPHTADKPALMREVFRVLRPGGRFVLQNVDPWSMREWITYQFFPEAWTVDQRDFLPVDSLNTLMRDAGFASISVTTRVVRDPESLQAYVARVSGRHSMSQLTAISDEAYARGLARVRDRLEAASGEDVLIPSTLTFLTIVAEKASG